MFQKVGYFPDRLRISKTPTRNEPRSGFSPFGVDVSGALHPPRVKPGVMHIKVLQAFSEL